MPPIHDKTLAEIAHDHGPTIAVQAAEAFLADAAKLTTSHGRCHRCQQPLQVVVAEPICVNRACEEAYCGGQ